MRTFLIAGCIYLIGTAIILAIKPSFMFTKDGIWKEFGIGRNPATHTWMPIWLFSILWAIISYILASILVFIIFGKSMKKNNIVADCPVEMPTEDIIMKKSIRKGKLPRGYYILNTDETESGIPSYIYLGKNLPEE